MYNVYVSYDSYIYRHSFPPFYWVYNWNPNFIFSLLIMQCIKLYYLFCSRASRQDAVRVSKFDRILSSTKYNAVRTMWPNLHAVSRNWARIYPHQKSFSYNRWTRKPSCSLREEFRVAGGFVELVRWPKQWLFSEGQKIGEPHYRLESIMCLRPWGYVILEHLSERLTSVRILWP